MKTPISDTPAAVSGLYPNVGYFVQNQTSRALFFVLARDEVAVGDAGAVTVPPGRKDFFTPAPGERLFAWGHGEGYFVVDLARRAWGSNG